MIVGVAGILGVALAAGAVAATGNLPKPTTQPATTQASSAPTASNAPTSTTATQPAATRNQGNQVASTPQKGRFIRQLGCKPPECGWAGCMKVKGGKTYASRSVSDGSPWLDISGLTEENTDKWPRYNGKKFWNPYALNGVEQDGGIRTEPGELPLVDPPKERATGPYWMKATWMTGSEDLNNLYRKNCAKKIIHRGQLYYVGPTKGGIEGVGTGSYVWYIRPRFDYEGPGEKWTHFIPQPTWENPKMMATAQTRNEDALDLMKGGYELPPWNRRGMFAAEQAIRSYCK